MKRKISLLLFATAAWLFVGCNNFLDKSPDSELNVDIDSEEKIAELLSLKQVVKELPPRDQNIIYFRYYKHRTQTETANALGMTQVQVSRREKVILQELRRKLV